MNKKNYLFLSAIGLLALSSCGQTPAASTSEEPVESSISSEASSIPSPESKISLHRASSRLIARSAIGGGSALLPTYHHADYGEAPYVELGEYAQALASSHLAEPGKIEKLAPHLYAFLQHGIIIFTVNPEEDVLVMHSYDSLSVPGNTQNNGVSWDPVGSSLEKGMAIHPSADTHIIGDYQEERYDFRHYDFDMVEDGDKVYVAFQPLSTLLYRLSTMDLAYNGLDFFATSYINEDVATYYPGAYSSYYASDNTFLYGGNLYSSYAPVGKDEQYRYAAALEDGKFSILSLSRDGTGSFKLASSPTEEGEAYPTPMQIEHMSDEDGILVGFTAQGVGFTGAFRIPNAKGYFNAKTRSTSVAKHTYDVLRFQFENVYGLKEELYARYHISSFDELVEKKHLKEKLLSTDAATYDDGLCELLLGNIDDGHTKYINRSLYSGHPRKDIAELVNAKTGERRKSLFELREQYQAKRTAAMTALDEKYADPTKQIGLFLEDNTAVIRFDAFLLKSMPTSFKEGEGPATSDITEAMNVSSVDGFYLAFQELDKHPEIDNVVIDLTVNGGGSAPTLAYLAATWTDDPTFVLKSTSEGMIREFHYEVDFNRNGVFGDEGDTYKDRFHFFILTSGFSFSCGNALPTMAHDDGIPVIGEHSGGGACPVGTFCDGSGTIFNSSMGMQIVYKGDDGEYVNNDAGIEVEPQYQLSSDSWYDLPALSSFVNGLSAKA